MASKKPDPERLFPAGYWGWPDLAKEGDQNPIMIHAAVGAALSSWEMAEEALSFLCGILSEAEDVKGSMAVRQIFGSIESSAGRRKALEKLSEAYFAPYQEDKIIKGPLDKLMTNFSEASKRRDDLAHGKVANITINETVFGHYLLPTDYNAGRNFLTPPGGDNLPFSAMRGKYSYTSSQILTLAKRFTELRDKIYEYSVSIKKVDGILPPIREKLLSPTAQKSQ
jgi:hypothetical protein